MRWGKSPLVQILLRMVVLNYAKDTFSLHGTCLSAGATLHFPLLLETTFDSALEWGSLFHPVPWSSLLRTSRAYAARFTLAWLQVSKLLYETFCFFAKYTRHWLIFFLRTIFALPLFLCLWLSTIIWLDVSKKIHYHLLLETLYIYIIRKHIFAVQAYCM